MLNVHAAAASPKGFFLDRITGSGRIYDLSCKDIKETRMFGIQISPPETKYIVLLCDITLDSGRKIPGDSEISIIKEEFDKLEIDDRVEIVFDIYQNFGEHKKLYPVTLKCIEKQEP